MEYKLVTVVTDEQSGHQGLYIDGRLVDQDSTIYPCDIARACEGSLIALSHIVVSMPENADRFPEGFAECANWAVVEA